MRNIFKKKTSSITLAEKSLGVVERDRLCAADFNLSEDRTQYLLSRYHPKRDCAKDVTVIVAILKNVKRSCIATCSTTLLMDLKKDPSMENLSILSSMANINIPYEYREKIIYIWSSLFFNCKTINHMVNVLKYMAKKFKW